jgi:hypothetical protein
MEGIFFCEECGQPLYGKFNIISTRHIDTKEMAIAANQKRVSLGGTAHLTAGGSVVFQIRGAQESIVLAPRDEMLLGRADPATHHLPAVDFEPYGAVENGISRKHAMIRFSENTLTLADLGSANGTQLNGYRLAPNQPRILRDGDEIQLGKLVVHVYFK